VSCDLQAESAGTLQIQIGSAGSVMLIKGRKTGTSGDGGSGQRAREAEDARVRFGIPQYAGLR